MDVRSPPSCLYLRIISSAPLVFLALLPDHASSFTWPQSKLSPKTYRSPASSRRLGHTNGTDLLESPQLCDPFSNVLERNSETTLFEQELLAGYIEHQSILNSPNIQLAPQQPGLTDVPSEPSSVLDSSTPASLTLPTQQSTATPILSDVWKARLLLLLSAALYGTNFTFVKSLNDSMSVGLSSTLRFGFAALVMLPMLFAPIDEELKVLVRERGHLSPSTPNAEKSNGDILSNVTEEPTRLSAGLAGMEIGMWVSIGYIAQAIGLQTTTASKSAFICSMAVVIVPILDKIVGKPLLRRQIVGACLAAFGVWALELGGQETAITNGDIMSMVQPLMFGLGFWRMESAVEKYPTEAARLAAGQLLMIFLVSLSYLVCFSPVVDGMLHSDTCNVLPTPSEIFALLHNSSILGMLFWTGVVTTAFTIYMETLALKTLSAAETTLIFSTEPLFGAAFAGVVANECFGIETAIGAVFIVGGCIVSGMDVSRYLKGDEAADEDATLNQF